MYKEIFRLINIIGQNHKKFSSGLSNELSKDNYKKKTMDKLVYSDDNKFNIEQNFKEFLLKYQEKLLEFQDNYNFTSNNEFINISAHNNKILGFICEYDLSYNADIHDKFNIKPADNRQSVYNVFIALQYFLDYDQFSNINNRLRKVVNKLNKRLEETYFNKIINSIGLPKEIKLMTSK